MPPKGERLTPEQVGTAPGLDRPGGDLARGSVGHAGRRRGPLGVPRRPSARPCPRSRTRTGRGTRSTASSSPGWRGGAEALARGRPGHADPPPEPRPDRPAAHDRGGRRLPRRHGARRLREGWSSGCWPRPHYGERWGRHWLDAARYADTDGYEKDKPRHIWFYRDWVINAFNRDLPYDRFVIEQLAGDLLPDATQDQVVATGFLRNSMINEEGGIDPEQFRMEAMFDRMEAIGKGVLGLTIQCAQCHTHKFDPITQEEYYRLFAFLNNDDEAQPRRLHARRADEDRRAPPADRRDRGAAAAHRPPTGGADGRWEDDGQGRPAALDVVHAPFDEISTGGQKYLPQKDGSFLAQGYAPTKHTASSRRRSTCRRSPPSGSSC